MHFILSFVEMWPEYPVGPRGVLHQTGADWKGFLWGGLQRHQQSHKRGGGYKNYRFGGSGG